MQIRTLIPGEEREWVQVDCADDSADERVQKLREYRTANPHLPAETYLVATKGGLIVGKLRTNTDDPTTYGLSYLAAAPGQDFATIGLDLIGHAKRHFRDRPLEAGSWARPEDEAWHALLVRSGFTVYIEKVYFRRDLEGYRSPHQDPFQYRSLAAVGEAHFLEEFVRIYPQNLNRNFNNADPRAEFFELKIAAGSTLDERQWLIAYHNDLPAGIVVPKIFDDIPDEGTIHTFGLFPEYRGKGYGKILHARGLEDLARAGAVRYVGSTDCQNTPMLATFKANGCHERGVRRQYRL